MIAAALVLAMTQHSGHGAPAACTAEHAAMGHCTQPKAKPRSAAKPPQPKTQEPRPASRHTEQPRLTKPATTAPDCTPEHAAMGHCQMSAAPAPIGPSGTALAAGNAPAPAAPAVDAADRIYGTAMTSSRTAMYREHGGGTWSQVMIDLAEVRVRRGRDGLHWDGEGWFGGDRDRLVIRSEGEGDFGRRITDAEVQALYSRAIGPYFNLQAGVRQDINAGPNRTYFAAGVKGLAPYWFELEATAFLSDRGDLSGRITGYYDQRITQRLILQPRAELNVATSADRARGIGGGITDFDLGLRLRYEFAREFAPYVGVAWERRLGATARYARVASDDVSRVGMVAGVRMWF